MRNLRENEDSNLALQEDLSENTKEFIATGDQKIYWTTQKDSSASNPDFQKSKSKSGKLNASSKSYKPLKKYTKDEPQEIIKKDALLSQSNVSQGWPLQL